MPRINPKKIAKQLEEQNKLYGDGEDQLGGSAPDLEVDDEIDSIIKTDYNSESVDEPEEPEENHSTEI